METFTCSICDFPSRGYGNNAEPINSERCCDDCNMTVVVPARFHHISDWKDEVLANLPDKDYTLIANIECHEAILNDHQIQLLQSQRAHIYSVTTGINPLDGTAVLSTRESELVSTIESLIALRTQQIRDAYKLNN